MAIEIIAGFALDFIGKVLLSISVFFVHARVIKERKIDKKVIGEMKRERDLAILGLAFIILGFLLQLPAKISGS